MRRRLKAEGGFSLTELLVVIGLLGVIGAATLTVIVSTSRSNAYAEELRTVMDDGRVSLDRIRKELRGGRRVLDGSTQFHLYWWVDRNQNGLQETSERIHYCVTPLGVPDGNNCLTAVPSPSVKYQLVRWSDAGGPTNATSIARTLVDPEVFSGYACPPSTCATGAIAQTDTVHITFDLDMRDRSGGPRSITMSASVRLRNVSY